MHLPKKVAIHLSVVLSLFATFGVQPSVSTELNAMAPGIRVVVGLSALESADVGALDKYIEPEIKKYWRKLWRGGRSEHSSAGGPTSGSGGGVAGAPVRRKRNVFKILLPNGRPPADFRYRYAFNSGVLASLGLETSLLHWRTDRATRVSALFISDTTRVQLSAPTGFGILADPTRARLQTSFVGYGGQLSAPVWMSTGPWLSQQLEVGGGILRYESKTYGKITSAFLDLYQEERRKRTSPLMSINYSIGRSPSNDASPSGAALTLGLLAFKTDLLWTVSLNAGLTYKFE